jgi:hypothetical protein
MGMLRRMKVIDLANIEIGMGGDNPTGGRRGVEAF